MIDAFVFNRDGFERDGTRVQTERRKADSDARAAVDLCPGVIDESDVMGAYAHVVGESRRTGDRRSFLPVRPFPPTMPPVPLRFMDNH